MRTTYDEILNSMRTKFFNVSGHTSVSMGDVDARLQAVAGELYSLSCYEDYLLKQAFVQTATGEYLDRHAELRGMARKQATKATVNLKFSLAEPVEQIIVIPIGTICSCSREPYIQFKTTSEGTIRIGATTVTVEAEAIEAGCEYNVEAHWIDTMVNAPTGVSGVDNSAKAKGGTADEGDEAFRKRIINGLKYIKSFNLLSIESNINNLDEVIKSKVYSNSNTITIYVQTADGSVSDATKEEISNLLYLQAIQGYNIQILNSTSKPVDFEVVISGKANEDSIIKCINDAVESNEIGEVLECSRLARAVNRLSNVECVCVLSDNATSGVISLGSGEHLILNEIVVSQE